jgi:hypothetical protein
MAKAKDKVLVELNVNSAPPAKIGDDRRGYVLSKTQAALCAIDNSAIMESLLFLLDLLTLHERRLPWK